MMRLSGQPTLPSGLKVGPLHWGVDQMRDPIPETSGRFNGTWHAAHSDLLEITASHPHAHARVDSCQFFLPRSMLP